MILVVGRKFFEQRYLSNFQKQPHQGWSVNNSVLKKFTKLTGNYLCFAILLKDSNTVVFL